MSSSKSQYTFPHSYVEVQKVTDRVQMILALITLASIVGAAIWMKIVTNFIGSDNVFFSIVGWVAFMFASVIIGAFLGYLVIRIIDGIIRLLAPNKKIIENWEAVTIWLKENHNINLKPISLAHGSPATKFFRNYSYDGSNQLIVLADEQNKEYSLVQTSNGSYSYFIRENKTGLFLLEGQKVENSNFSYEEQETVWRDMLRRSNVYNSKLEEIGILLQKLDRAELTEAQISTVAQVIAKTNEIYINYVKLARATDNGTADKATNKALSRLLTILKNVQAEYVSSIEEKIDTQVSWIDTLLGREQILR